MHLKRLEIFGFKSFGERIGLDFVPGVTAVVGPNGSGKSNVTDAIRWVLGEQSAKTLRGGKMEDVIFSGSESRKPLNFAEVTLILDNSDGRVPLDFQEISVSRRVFRSGDSEYQINRQACRLRDITDLFMDSGLGKEAFSVISQGRVDEILNSKPEDRRSIFEEAAGVLKYKQRRRKAEHKLFETEDNLNRVLDILHELEGRLEPLRIQASAAEDFLAMSGELKTAEIALIAHDLEENRNAREVVRKKHDAAAEKERQASAEAESRDAVLAGLRSEAAALADELDGLHKELAEAVAGTEKWEGRRLVMQERRTNAVRQLERLRADLSEAEAAILSTTGKQAEAERLAAEKKEALSETRKEIRRLQDVAGRPLGETEKRIDELKSVYIERLSEEAAVNNELKHLRMQIDQQKESAERNRSRAEETAGELDKVRRELRRAEEAAGNLQKRLTEAERLDSEREEAERKLAGELADKQEQLYKAYSLQEKLKGRKEALLAMEAEHAGFHTGVKEVLRAAEKGRLQGIEGAVAKLLDVRPEFAKAIETALGGGMQHIVTASESDARRAIAHLKESRKGRATFLPLPVMKPRQVDAQTLARVNGHGEYKGTGDSVVSADSRYSVIVRNLLGNVIIAATLKGANEIAKMAGYRYRVVTLDGDVVNAGGSMTGGGSDRNNPIFMRKAELESVSADLVRLEGSIGNAEQAVRQLKLDKQELSGLRGSAQKQLADLRKEGQAANEQLAELKSAERRLSDRAALFTDEEQGTAGMAGGLSKRLDAAGSRKERLTAELKEISDEIEKLGELYEQGRNERDRMMDRLGELRSEAAVLAEQAAQAAAASDTLQTELRSLGLRAGRLNEEIGWLEGDGSDGLGPEEIEQELAGWKKRRKEAEQAVAGAVNRRAALEGRINLEQTRYKQASAAQAEHARISRETELRAGRLDYEFETLSETLIESYGLEEAPAAEFPFPEGLDAESARRKVRLLKQSIDELGPVNTGAIDEFAAVSERHQFLSDQRSDLLEAKETLEETIGEMDAEVTERFGSTFHAVNRQFGIVFRELFGGGRTELVLTNPDDLLTTGIDIVACPPGKKLQNLSLLSGGERALTAIALLFAILKVRPVPFCVLDEVEAALDEANVLRYSNYLKKFSDETQFIVITHRKGTMEGADVLYGITMQESGISKPVSVKLTEGDGVEYEEPVPAGGAG
ncbi:chromosome segregation protein SMC [Edaphobacillus lindanitolerans]|uniref:chromosome segregation protein SMC n=1 Tax=Edaphobacillus lindanitolerans TaxID=550447 RepID=UPI000976485D|nr:chromosome segregation protein SMC [Edaphobacillus lindanitolerans]